MANRSSKNFDELLAAAARGNTAAASATAQPKPSPVVVATGSAGTPATSSAARYPTASEQAAREALYNELAKQTLAERSGGSSYAPTQPKVNRYSTGTGTGSGTGSGSGSGGSSGGTDWSVLINQGIDQGIDWRTIQEYQQNRQNKIYGDYGTLGQYDNDATYQRALEYIMRGQAAEQAAKDEEQRRYQEEQLRILREAQERQSGGGVDVASLMSALDSITPAQPTYTPSEWDATKEALARAALEMNYDDWTKSDQYASLASRYGHNGQLVMQDILGQIASRTGGLASSYATTAAQQQYNEYMAQLEDAARQQFSAERSSALQNAQLAYDFSDNDYQRYLDRLAQYNTDRGYAFDILAKALDESHYADEWQRTLDQDAYAREQDALDRELALAKLGASYGDVTGIQGLGIDTSNMGGNVYAYSADGDTYTIGTEKGQSFIASAAPGQTMTGGDGSTWTKWDDGSVTISKGGKVYTISAAQAAAPTSGGGSGKKASDASARYSDIRKNALAYDTLEQAEAYLNRMVDAGYITPDEASDIYLVDLGGGTSPSISGSAPTTYGEFVSRTGNSTIMTENEFKRAAGTARTAGYSSYQDYLAQMWEKYGK